MWSCHEVFAREDMRQYEERWGSSRQGGLWENVGAGHLQEARVAAWCVLHTGIPEATVHSSLDLDTELVTYRTPGRAVAFAVSPSIPGCCGISAESQSSWSGVCSYKGCQTGTDPCAGQGNVGFGPGRACCARGSSQLSWA